ncbi:flagellar motor switch protein FliG [Alkalilimnicola ehrlichii]|uniref:Flagellar motor switch protein FliG n=1 Tax=Alkalilimnicola ehrlichii TaxID=351052 RepID=A0A3E0WUP0_9GAMM|nr:flagellar motor switch protein FliG [Alkalilimnicola ehrlichii]RFA35706.1 flagellar motor switch protein FliG [Alkalilimnicola ehrlichii]
MTERDRSGELMTNAERAAIFMMSISEDEAASVMRHLGPKEVQKLGQAMTQLRNVNREQAAEVLQDFIGAVSQQTTLGLDATDYIRKVLVKALGEEKAGGILDRIMMGGSTRGLEQLKWLDGKTIAEMVRLEHPQIVAIVLSYLDSDHAAQVVAELPERSRHDIIMRVATLEGVQPAALQELDEIMARQFTGKQRLKSSSIGGLQSAANILNHLDSSVENSIMGQIRDIDNELGEQIQDLMFVFSDLTDIDDRSMQSLLREVETNTLVLALKGADEGMKEKVFKNLSRRAGEMLKEDLASKGPVRITDVEAAQKEILATAKRMSDEGQIALSGTGEEFV